MNANAFSQKDYENETAFRPQKNKPNFKRDDGFSPQLRLSAWGRLTVGMPYGGVPGTAYYKRLHCSAKYSLRSTSHMRVIEY